MLLLPPSAGGDLRDWGTLALAAIFLAREWIAWQKGKREPTLGEVDGRIETGFARVIGMQADVGKVAERAAERHAAVMESLKAVREQFHNLNNRWADVQLVSRTLDDVSRRLDDVRRLIEKA